MAHDMNDAEITIFEGGVLGRSQRLDQIPVFVAPSIGAEFNTIIAGLIPVACFRVDNVRFAFASSFISPGIQPELARLGGLLKAHPPASMAGRFSPPRAGSPLSVFGHADPSGDDEYNKVLSGRRAQAIHALLVRDVDSWNELYSLPKGEDKWGLPAIRVMLNLLGRSSEAAESFDRNAAQRKPLFADYMEELCGIALPPLDRQDFLGRGSDAKGKGDFQGCGEFNPLRVFSVKRQTAFDRQPDKTARNAANEPNRRVMVLIFRPGSKVEPDRWPCPRASESSAGCRKRFWSDGEKRRSLRRPDEDREFEFTKDTFACRFYHRLSDKSPCEALISGGFAAWEVDPLTIEPAAGIDVRDAPDELAVDDPRASALRRGQ